MAGWTKIVFVLGGLLAMATCAWGQQGQLSGFVRDPSGAVIAKASVTVENMATGSQQATTTNEAGIYAFTLLPPATYRLTVEARGFQKKVVNNVTVDVTAKANLNVELAIVVEPGQVAALNRGIEAATGDVIAITDDDAAPRADWVARIAAAFESDPKLGALGGRDWVQKLAGESNAVSRTPSCASSSPSTTAAGQIRASESGASVPDWPPVGSGCSTASGAAWEQPRSYTTSRSTTRRRTTFGRSPSALHFLTSTARE